MSSIVTPLLKSTIGLLVDIVRDKVAHKLKDGDVTDQEFRRMIVREIDEVKSKLDGLSRKDLLASISFFKEGIELLYEVFEKTRSRSDNGGETTQAACAEAVSIVKGERLLDLTDLDESATEKLSDAKGRFKDARRKATEAFNNEALETTDRILAMKYRVMATILETVDNPARAVAPCRVCIKDLNSLSAIQESFNVELTKGFRARFRKDERRNIISNVCHLNFVIYVVTLMVSFGDKELAELPSIGSGEKKVNPLRDERVANVLRKQGMEHFCVLWSFGQEGEEEHKLKDPWGIATNSSGQLMVGDCGASNVKVFDSTGTFTKLFSPTNDDDVDSKLYVQDVATDMNDNIFLLVTLKKPKAERYERAVYEFNNTADLHHKFAVSGDWASRLTVTDSGKVVVLKTDYMVVYKIDGQLFSTSGKDILKDARDITAAKDGRVMVLEWGDSCVHIFSENGNVLNKFNLLRCYSWPKIAFNRASKHVVVASFENEKDLLHVDIYTKDGEFVRSTQIQERIGDLRGAAVTTEGRIAVACICKYSDKKEVPLVHTKMPARVLVT